MSSIFPSHIATLEQNWPETRQKLLDRIFSIPVVKEMGVTFKALEPGYCKISVPRRENWDGSYASFHGGLLAAVADTVACFAVMPQTDPDEILTTTDLHIRYLRPCLTDVTAEARLVKLGKTLCPVTVELFDEQGEMVAIASVTYMRLHQMPSRPNKPNKK